MGRHKSKGIKCPQCGRQMEVIAISYLPDESRKHSRLQTFRYREYFDYQCPAGHRTSNPPYILRGKD